MLDQSWPSFLDMLESSPDEAFRQLYSFACRLLKVKPPGSMRRLSKTESQDLTQDIILHCTRDNFRVLRQYSDCGKPFAAWLYILAHRKCLDYLRARKRESMTVQYESDMNSPDLDWIASDSDIDPLDRTNLKRVIECVKDCMSRLRKQCQLLLQLAADEYTPREMALVLGWPEESNKKVSDDLRQCRKQLKKIVASEGIDLVSVLQS
jgi:RNA polymerase sigma factor (sigma-70 family)